MYATFSRTLQRNDIKEDISDFWDVMEVDKSNFLDNVIELSYIDGKCYGVPMQYNVAYLYWNKDLFKDAGLDPDIAPKTMEELNVLQKIEHIVLSCDNIKETNLENHDKIKPVMVDDIVIEKQGVSFQVGSYSWNMVRIKVS